jgi:putative nucleotidyltransferase with HDIG domain
MGRSVVEILRSGLTEEQQAEARELLSEKSSFRNERIHSRKNGQTVYVEENTIALTDEHRKITGYVSVNRDITERKQAEAALRENEQLLSEAQRIGHVGSWSYNLIDDSLQYSDEMYRLLDVSPREFSHTSQGFLGLIYPSDQSASTKWMDDIKNGRQTRELDFRIFRKNGELRQIQCRGAIIFSSAGKPVRFTGMAQDITERKLAEIQIRQQIERLSALRKIDQAITSNFDLHFTLNTLMTEVTTQLQVDAADILLLHADEQVLTFAAGRGFRTRANETARVPIGESYAGRVAKERRLVRIENLRLQRGNSLLDRLVEEENFVCYYGVPLISKGTVTGVLEVFHRSTLQPYPEWLDFLNALAGQAAIAIDNATLFENLERSNRELSQAYDATIEGWSRALDLRDKETEGHTRRVTALTLELARRYGFPPEELLYIRWGALLHDMGKMGVPDRILHKPDKLTEEEWASMRKHPGFAFEMLSPIEYLKSSLDIPYCHHEKWDGTGYPRGLKGEEIPLTARLFSVVDVWDALTSNRPYRPAWTGEEALTYIRGQAGKYFDPQVVELFFKVIE